MDDLIIRMLAYGVIILFQFGGVYLYGRKWHPKLAPALCGITGLTLFILVYFSTAWLAASLLLSLIYLFILRKPNQKAAFSTLYSANQIFTATNYSQAVLDILGDKNWKFAEGVFKKSNGENLKYGFWQGHTSQMVSTGKYGRSTVFNYYLAFVFAPNTVSDAFKQAAIASADKSKYSFGRKFKNFFVIDTETPSLVKDAADGSFVIQYPTKIEADVYERRIAWIKSQLANEPAPKRAVPHSDI